MDNYIILDYSFYSPRIDKVLNKIKSGVLSSRPYCEVKDLKSVIEIVGNLNFVFEIYKELIEKNLIVDMTAKSKLKSLLEINLDKLEEAIIKNSNEALIHEKILKLSEKYLAMMLDLRTDVYEFPEKYGIKLELCMSRPSISKDARTFWLCYILKKDDPVFYTTKKLSELLQLSSTYINKGLKGLTAGEINLLKSLQVYPELTHPFYTKYSREEKFIYFRNIILDLYKKLLGTSLEANNVETSIFKFSDLSTVVKPMDLGPYLDSPSKP